MSPLLFTPNLHTTVWGGHRLTAWKALPPVAEPVGESWEVSGVPSSVSVIASGEWRGRLLTDVIREHPDTILGPSVARRFGAELPLLVKIIDAERDLSVQVHPDDAMARRHGQANGKTEMWYVIDAKPGACLYAGFRERLSREDYTRRVADGTICEALARHEVRPGDVFFLPAGRVHAICGGILLAEVQQSSDTTYRIYDYNRPGIDGKPRELHTALAAEALNFEVLPEYRTVYGRATHRAMPCIDTPFFSVRVVDAVAPFHRNLVKYDSFVISLCVSGSCEIRPRGGGEGVTLREGYACLIPAMIADYDILPLSGRVRLLDAFIDNKDRSLLSKATRFLHITDR